jgi:hypothetical protein
MKYKELAANRTRVYPMILGIKRKTTLWFSSGCGVSDCGVTVTDPGDFFFEGDGMVVQEQSKQARRAGLSEGCTGCCCDEAKEKGAKPLTCRTVRSLVECRLSDD